MQHVMDRTLRINDFQEIKNPLVAMECRQRFTPKAFNNKAQGRERSERTLG